MNALMADLERDERRRRSVRLLVVLAILTGAGAWLTGPWGIVMLTRGEAIGWLLVASGVVLFAAAVTAIIVARRLRLRAESLPGKPNARFDEPEPSPNPNGGYSLAGSQIGSR